MSNGVITVTEMHLCTAELPCYVGGDMSKNIEILCKNKCADEKPTNSLGQAYFCYKNLQMPKVFDMKTCQILGIPMIFPSLI